MHKIKCIFVQTLSFHCTQTPSLTTPPRNGHGTEKRELNRNFRDMMDHEDTFIAKDLNYCAGVAGRWGLGIGVDESPHSC